MADEELRRAFSELQVKIMETNQKMRLAESQIQALKMNIVHAQLTEKEITSLPEETNTYISVGRIFLLQPRSDVKMLLQQKQTEAKEKISGIETNMQYWGKNVKETEANLRDMVSHRRDK